MSLLDRPIEVNQLKLKNRLVMPPMATETADLDGKVTPGLLDYYRRKAQGGYIGLIITEYMYVNEEGKASKNQLSIANDEVQEGLRELVGVIHENGSKTFAQLHHAGGAADRKLTGKEPYGPSRTALPGSLHLFQEMTVEQIKEVVLDFTRAALRAKEAGYDGVEIHSAHGYLLDQFYSPLTNLREDAYGKKTLEDRLRFQVEIISSIRKAVGQTYPIALRLGACDYLEGGSTLDDAIGAGKILQKAGLDLLDISGGLKGYTHPENKEPGYFKDASKAVKETLSIPIILTGGVTKRTEAESLLEEGAADLVGVGRAILKDDLWAQKAMEQGQ